jgi:hypothetical protein
VDRISVETMAVAVLADGDSPAAIANSRGHLLETFLAQLLALLGYEDPRAENLKVTSDGIEIDVVARARVTGQGLIGECKAYSANVSVSHLTSFVGKYALAREDDAHLSALFLALPRLTANAREQAEEVQRKFPLFRYLGSVDVIRLLIKGELLPPIAEGPALHSDLTVVITEHGLALAAREIDPRSRRAARVVVWNKQGTVPDPVRDLIERSELAAGLPVSVPQARVASVPLRPANPPAIVMVRGSSSDFEYQLPASPKFFVGRKALAASLVSDVSQRTDGGTVVVNAKSGWGKSSLALQLGQRVRRGGGVAQIVDSRTAESPGFVSAAVESIARVAVERRILRLPRDAAFSSLSSSVRSLGNAEWRRRPPLLLFFDQFENVFRSEELTREFRDLAALVGELHVPLTVGFAWKTDLVGWTEDHPYRLRDEIRETARVALLEPLGPREVETLLRRLERAAGEKLHRDLRRRLREYSQGLPWLFKKLGGHILDELGRGITQEGLLRESLNVQSLFERDLAELTLPEQEGIRAIARFAPALVSELEETVPAAIVQSLINRRLVVQVGERIDTYWDTFRDFLLTGRVAIEDSYVIRYGPASVGKLLRRLMAAGGELSVPDAANELRTSSAVVFNLSRELRLMGLVVTESNRVTVERVVLDAEDPEAACRLLVARALRRHKILSVVSGLVAETDEGVSFARAAASLPAAFPAVEANQESWLTYARAFCQWLAYGRLVDLSRDGIRDVNVATPDPASVFLLSGAVPVRVQSAFPQGAAGPAEQLLLHLSDTSRPRPQAKRHVAAVRDLSLLGAVILDERDRLQLARAALIDGDQVDPDELRGLVEQMPGCADCFRILGEEPAVSPARLGEILRVAHRAEWRSSTAHSIGKYVRSWARLCGVCTTLRPPRVDELPGQGQFETV